MVVEILYPAPRTGDWQSASLNCRFLFHRQVRYLDVVEMYKGNPISVWLPHLVVGKHGLWCSSCGWLQGWMVKMFFKTKNVRKDVSCMDQDLVAHN